MRSRPLPLSLACVCVCVCLFVVHKTLDISSPRAPHLKPPGRALIRQARICANVKTRDITQFSPTRKQPLLLMSTPLTARNSRFKGPNFFFFFQGSKMSLRSSRGSSFRRGSRFKSWQAPPCACVCVSVCACVCVVCVPVCVHRHGCSL